MTTTPDDRADILAAYEIEMRMAADELLDAMLNISLLGDQLHLHALDTLTHVVDGEMPDAHESVGAWNLLVRVREELDRAQKAWRDLDTKAMHVSVVTQRPYYQALPMITGEVQL